MANVTIIIMVHQMFIVSVDNGIYSTLSAACIPPCNKLSEIFMHGLIADSAFQNVFFISSAHALFKKKNSEEGFY